MTKLTRREFLKVGGASLTGIVFLPLPPRDQAARDVAHLGRITDWSVWVRTEPDHGAPSVRRHGRDDVIVYFEEIEAEGQNPHNPVWFRVIDGFVYSSYVQPVQRALNAPVQHIPSRGLWGEVSVPYTEARRAPSPAARRTYRLHYSSVYRVAESVWGTDQRLWYRLFEHQMPHVRLYVDAEHVRLFLPEEIAPLSPRVLNKHIEISLADQLLTAFEDEEPVFSTHISGGTGGNRATPRGTHRITFKSAARHMVGDGYDLPGVCFDSYFWGGVAIHGTYWHNDFGRPRSHGCVNVPSLAARWIYRWTVPVPLYEKDWVRVPHGGTPVIVY